jgi:hypothetical protein
MTSPSTHYTDLSGPVIASDWLNAVNTITFPSKNTSTNRPILTVDQVGVLFFDTTLAAAGAGETILNGWLKTLNYYPQQLTTAEVQAFSKG